MSQSEFFKQKLTLPWIFVYLGLSLAQGNPVGQSGLGMAYLYGRGVPVVNPSTPQSSQSDELQREGEFQSQCLCVFRTMIWR